MMTPEQESTPEKPAEGERPWNASHPTPARTALGTTLAVFFTITGIGAAFQATCIATTAGSSNLVAGMLAGVIAALIAAGVLVNVFWHEPPSTPK